MVEKVLAEPRRDKKPIIDVLNKATLTRPRMARHRFSIGSVGFGSALN
jgi:hypothetical protein